MGVAASGFQEQTEPRLIVRRTVLQSRPDWFLLCFFLIVIVSPEAWEWFTEPRWPRTLEIVTFSILMFLCFFNITALWRSPEVLVADDDGLALPDYYEESIPWNAITSVERKGLDVFLRIEGAERFGRKRRGLYRLFPEQARYKGDDLQIVDTNRTDVAAETLASYIEQRL